MSAGRIYSVEQIAEAAYETVRAYSEAIGGKLLPPWEGAADWERRTVENGVLFLSENPHAAPASSHDSWMKEKFDTGWKYGPIKDPEKKEHPCLVPYCDLPAEERAKDYIFCAVVLGMLGLLE